MLIYKCRIIIKLVIKPSDFDLVKFITKMVRFICALVLLLTIAANAQLIQPRPTVSFFLKLYRFFIGKIIHFLFN